MQFLLVFQPIQETSHEFHRYLSLFPSRSLVRLLHDWGHMTSYEIMWHHVTTPTHCVQVDWFGNTLLGGLHGDCLGECLLVNNFVALVVLIHSVLVFRPCLWREMWREMWRERWIWFLCVLLKHAASAVHLFHSFKVSKSFLELPQSHVCTRSPIVALCTLKKQQSLQVYCGVHWRSKNAVK